MSLRSRMQGVPRRVTMPRLRPETETGKIQSPEIGRQLQQALGMRQMHVAPTISGEVQPVIVVQDLARSAAASPITYAAHRWVLPNTATDATWSLWNPFDSQVIVRLIRFEISPAIGDILNFGTAVTGELPGPPPNDAGNEFGVRLAQGRGPGDLINKTLRSVANLRCSGNLQISTATYMEHHGLASDRAIFDLSGVILYPAGVWQVWQHNGVGQDGTVFWTEEPIQ